MNGTKARRTAAIERYIHDLAIALAGLPVDEREDVIAGVREHIEDALTATSDPAEEDVQRVLTSLGDPAEIAADARSRSNAPPAPPPATAPTKHVAASVEPVPQVSVLAQDWVPVGTMALFAGAGFITWFSGPGASPLALLLWLGGLVMLIGSPLWNAAEKIIGAAWFGVLPIAGALIAGVGLGLAGPFRGALLDVRPIDIVAEYGSRSYFWWPFAVGAGVVAVAGTLAIMAWLVSAGSARARSIKAGT